MYSKNTSTRENVRTFSPQQPAKNTTYLILCHSVDDDLNVLAVRRGKARLLVEIPTAILTVKTGDQILEITEAGGYRVPKTRPVLNEHEIDIIQKAQPATTLRG